MNSNQLNIVLDLDECGRAISYRIISDSEHQSYLNKNTQKLSNKNGETFSCKNCLQNICLLIYMNEQDIHFESCTLPIGHSVEETDVKLELSEIKSEPFLYDESMSFDADSPLEIDNESEPASPIRTRNCSKRLDSKTKLPCEHCDRTFKNKLSLSSHKRYCSAENPFTETMQCNICDKTFSSNYSLKTHKEIEHKVNPRHQCSVCNLVFPTPSKLATHMHRHMGIRPKCEICLKDFCDDNARKKHIQKEHGLLAGKRRKCTICSPPKRFASKENYEIHLKQVHPDIEVPAQPELLEVKLEIAPEVADKTESYRPYKCSYCPKAFEREKSYKYHMLTHTNPSPYKCDLCSAEFAQKVSIRDHIDKKHNKSYKWHFCRACSPKKKFFKYEKYQNHMEIVHAVKVEPAPKKEFRCDGCNELFKNSLSMSTHRRFCDSTNRNATPMCTYCGKVYSKWYTVREHIRQVHEETYIFQCELCGKAAKSRKQLRYHINKTHGPPEIYSCDQCSKKFKSKDTLAGHIHVKHLNIADFVCEICCKKFYKKQNLDAHLNLVHKETRPFACDQCTKTFKIQAQLQAHQFSMHVPDELKRKFPCHLCDFVTSTEGYLKKHQLVHLPEEEKPYHCRFCLKGFGTEHDLNRHETSHTNERNFHCKECGKGFVTRNELKQHFIAQHTQDKPFVCQVCQLGHKDRWTYRTHLIGHEREMGITLDKSIKKFMEKYKDLQL